MIINSFSIRHNDSIKEKAFSFDKSVEYFFSQENSVGKTTFLRAVLFCLGFQIPSTKKVNFEHYYFEIDAISNSGEKLHIRRNNNVLNVNDIEFNPQTESAPIIQRIFGLSNLDLINNLLAIIYIDQDKGWTLLNRGKVVGSNAFNIESFLRGLNDKNVADLNARLKVVNDDIDRYSLMLNVAEYQKRLDEHKDEIVEITFDDASEAELGILQNRIDQLDKEIKHLSDVRHNNSAFVDYITRLGLQIRIDGKDYIINKNNLLNFKEIQTINDLRLLKLKSERNDLVTKKERLMAKIKPNTLFETKTVIESFDESISRNKIDALQVQSILNTLHKERDNLKEAITRATIEDNKWVSILNSYLKEYWKDMNIELEYKDSYLLTRDLKSLSGALLYKVIIAFKMAYFKVLKDKTGFAFPIFIDSPTGREVKKDIVERALTLVKRDFSEHQIFISSVIDYSHIFGCNSNSKLVFDGLHAFDPITLFDVEGGE